MALGQDRGRRDVHQGHPCSWERKVAIGVEKAFSQAATNNAARHPERSVLCCTTCSICGQSRILTCRNNIRIRAPAEGQSGLRCGCGVVWWGVESQEPAENKGAEGLGGADGGGARGPERIRSHNRDKMIIYHTDKAVNYRINAFHTSRLFAFSTLIDTV